MNEIIIETKKRNSNTSIYTKKELYLLDEKKIPNHIAVIMDGNRRWGKKRGVTLPQAYKQGAEVLAYIVRAAVEIGVKIITAFTFSTENWMRSPKEIKELMKILEEYLVQKRPIMQEEGVCFDTIGDLSKLSFSLQKELIKTKKVTNKGKKIDLILALNYGGRNEITRAMTKILSDYKKGKITKKIITEELLSDYLDTSKWKDPDMLIRTSGEQRLSNFLLWQISYSEVVVCDVLWPDFSKENLLQAVLEFQKRKRRRGG